MLNSYYTIKKQTADETIIQKSRFIGHVKRAETEEEAQAFIQEIKKQHNGANHNCSAYLIGEHDQIQKANDDGEPSGTAGVPILEVLKKKELKDTVVVVTRYFGGIKLGAGGLIRAYSGATSQAIAAAGIVKRQLVKKMAVTIDYTLLGKVENQLHQSPYMVYDMSYQENVQLVIAAEAGQEEAFITWITDLTSDQAEIQPLEEEYIEVDLET